jgi:hypothetical protein
MRRIDEASERGMNDNDWGGEWMYDNIWYTVRTFVSANTHHNNEGKKRTLEFNKPKRKVAF